jgi:NADPH2:quinone reductase
MMTIMAGTLEEMRAIICEAWGEPSSLLLADVRPPVCGPGQVRIAVEAIGVNFADLLMIRGLYQVKPPFPFSPGFEVAGTVIEAGAGVGSSKVGDRVYAYTTYGAYQEQVSVAATSTFLLPEPIPLAEAAAMPVAFGTSYHALVDRGILSAGETLLVLGASGGVGTAAIQIGKMLGATVVAAVSSEAKAEFAAQQGADHVIRYDQEKLRDRIHEITGGSGADVVFDPVGGPHLETAFRSLAWGGRHLVVGFAGGSIPALPVNLSLLKGASLVGVYWGAFMERQPERGRENLATITRLFQEGRLKSLITRRYPLEEAGRALDNVASRLAMGKVILEV